MIQMKHELEKAIAAALKELGVVATKVPLEHPEVLAHGDYATSVALAYAKQLGMKPRDLAEKLVEKINPLLPEGIERVLATDIAGPGFINFRLTRTFFAQSVVDIVRAGVAFGANTRLNGQKVLVEYTDPNPFKVFHIGHLMSNAIGESIARLMQANGAHTLRLNYQGDVGLHVAKALWGMMHVPRTVDDNVSLSHQVAYLGRAYTFGANKFEEDELAQAEMKSLNKEIFERSNAETNALYDWGRKVSLEHFEEIYKKLGTKFDHYFFESEVAGAGIAVVREFLGRGVFAESDGAVVFKGEEHGLHTRVFINSQGLPTYEAKELGLNKKKFELYKPNLSIVVTANEVTEYFKVVLRAMSLIYPEVAEHTKHVSHGMLRFAEGKMSSRKGNIITGESLLADTEALVQEKMKDRDFSAEVASKIAEQVAVGAIKYAVLRSAAGSDIVYDREKSISFEGDSGPYLQYALVRAESILAKAKSAGIKAESAAPSGAISAHAAPNVSVLEKLLYRFPEVVERAGVEFQPHYVTTFLTTLASEFNAYYANNQIVDEKDLVGSAHRVALTTAFTTVMKNGLTLLGIPVPERM